MVGAPLILGPLGANQAAAGAPAASATTLRPLSCSLEPTLSAQSGTPPADISFSDQSAQPVTIYQLDLQGKRDLWWTLAPGDSIKGTANVTQPFVVTTPSGHCLAIFEAAAAVNHVVLGHTLTPSHQSPAAYPGLCPRLASGIRCA